MESEQASMDKMTEGVEEAGTGGSATVDGESIKAAMEELALADAQAREQELARKKELSAVTVAAADLEVVMASFELDKLSARTVLQENGGDLKATLVKIVTTP